MLVKCIVEPFVRPSVRSILLQERVELGHDLVVTLKYLEILLAYRIDNCVLEVNEIGSCRE